MKTTFLTLALILILSSCKGPVSDQADYTAVSQVSSGKAFNVMLTAYSTTLIANGKDQVKLRIAITDSLAREITTRDDSVRVFVTGDGRITAPDGKDIAMKNDTAGLKYVPCKLENGLCNLLFIAGTTPGKVKVEAKSGKLWPGAHEIHTLPATFVMMKPTADQLPATTLSIRRMIGADISWLQQMEADGKKFYENGKETDAIRLLKEHGFNAIRLRIFVNPENEKGYSPVKGFCGLAHTLAMAKRVKEAGMELLLDFHYSDYWADPQQQYKPLSWSTLPFNVLQDTVKAYTTRVVLALEQQGTTPAMVQVGNEINHGLLWPDGHISQPDNLAALLKAGIEGVRAADPSIPVMLHIALGGQNQEAVFWLDNMIARGVQFDLIGLSYYPRWHGTLNDLNANLRDLAQRYKKPLNVVEYSNYKKEVHDIIFSLPDNLGTGACIWEPLNAWSGLFDREGNAAPLFSVYDSLGAKYIKSVK
jgi:hypothetical protein